MGLQVALSEDWQVVDGPWSICWGNLGTGLVGVSLRGEEMQKVGFERVFF